MIGRGKTLRVTWNGKDWYMIELPLKEDLFIPNIRADVSGWFNSIMTRNVNPKWSKKEKMKYLKNYFELVFIKTARTEFNRLTKQEIGG